ncbi:DUF4190 domain-containing protein [Agromyces aerolatus]|uniref:DUF4190 domain-containing protein n=1 Tax=Agromyces sp. LY-1074 TaxID=3074080 RepID=UPI0028592809|nr:MULTISPECIES: DUF4190 domain-containing protein [unclassified Agromyces]MDR5698354.1 DUF4190 domain-containing protein [Agromyces sp. LY-1074]MDR5704648.1 DUF4190 domain-containing protein [Agromyces sp. LY-1358]
MTDHSGTPWEGRVPVPPPEPGATPAQPGGGAAEPALRGAEPASDAPDPALRAAEPVSRDFDDAYDTGRLQQLPTGQLLLLHRPGLPDPVPVPESEADDEVQRRVYSWIGAIAGAVGALASLFVGWMLPLSIAAIVFGVLGLRREEHGRTLAFVAIGTGITGLVFSAVWLGYYAIVYGALPA